MSGEGAGEVARTRKCITKNHVNQPRTFVLENVFLPQNPIRNLHLTSDSFQFIHGTHRFFCFSERKKISSYHETNSKVV
jgi:hypothetical protein